MKLTKEMNTINDVTILLTILQITKREKNNDP